MARDPRTEEVYRQLRLQLPRILVLVGIGLLVAGIVATVAFVAADSGCNAATNLTSPGGATSSGSLCGHEHGFLTISFLTVVLGAILIGIGGMILPTLRARDAREQAAAAGPFGAAPAVHVPSTPPPAAPSTAAEPVEPP